MRFLLDTSVISQLTKPAPPQHVAEWLSRTSLNDLYLSSISLFELRVGVDQLPAGKRRSALTHWLDEDVSREYRNRTFAVDAAIAHRGAQLLVKARATGWNSLELDALIAATAQVHRLTLATLNQKYFAPFDLDMVEF